MDIEQKKLRLSVLRLLCLATLIFFAGLIFLTVMRVRVPQQRLQKLETLLAAGETDAVRRLAGAHHRALLPLSALGGGLFLVACDQAGRLFGEVEVPAGVITALAGGPFFLYLLIRHARNQK